MKLGYKERAMLEDINSGDLLVGFLASFGSVGIMKKVALSQASARIQAENRRQNKNRLLQLEKKSLITITGQKDKRVILLTAFGTKMIEKHKVISVIKNKINKEPSWDGVWRMVTFDVPKKHDTYRYDLRHMLLACGFVQVQQSVYVFPYSCSEMIEYISQHKIISKYCHVFEGSYIGDDKKLKKKFGIR